MDGKSQNPFEVIDEIVNNDTSDIHIVDFQKQQVKK